MNEEVYQALANLKSEGRSGVLCTVIETRGSTPRKEGSKMLVYPGGEIVGSIGGGEVESRVITQALAALQTGETAILSFDLVDPEKGDPGVCGGVVDVFLEPLPSVPVLVVVGGGHVGREVVRLGHWLGYRVVLNEDREEFCTPDAVPEADEYVLSRVSELPSLVDLNDRTAVVMATRNMTIDTEGLPEILEFPVSYVGVISSRRRWRLTRDELLEEGVEEDLVEGVRAPIGLDLNAETPEEIALSIMSEVVMVQRGGRGLPLSQQD